MREEENRITSQRLYLINPELTVNPYPTLRFRCRKFIGPEDQLFDITFEQFMYMQTYLDAAGSSKDQPSPSLPVASWKRI